MRNTTTAVAPPASPLVTIDELRAWLNPELSPRRIYDAVRRGQIPGRLCIGRRVYISRIIVEEWLRHGKANGQGGRS